MSRPSLTVTEKSKKVIDYVTAEWSAAFDGSPERQMEALHALTDDIDYFYCEELAGVYDAVARKKWPRRVADIVQRRKQLTDWRN